ncbi:MAG: hypothetical protein H0U27_06470 [Nitrosopumilus sp.]|nr:hypothetical protein [Nitrosopumilus sp.]
MGKEKKLKIPEKGDYFNYKKDVHMKNLFKFSKLKKLIPKTLAVFGLTFCLSANKLDGFFDRNVGETLTFNVTFDISGTVQIHPYISYPTGEMSTQPSTLSIGPSISYIFEVTDPWMGAYQIGCYAKAVGAPATVTLDTVNTNMVLSKVDAPNYGTIYPKPTVTLHSISPNTGEICGLSYSEVYSESLSNFCENQ